MMRTIRLLVCAAIVGNGATCCAQIQCLVPSPIPPTETERSGDVKGAFELFKALVSKFPLGSANAEASYQSHQHDVLAKFPNADQVALRQQELYYVCQTLNEDRKLTTRERVEIYHRAASGLDTSRFSHTPPNTRNGQARQPSSPAPANTAPPSSITINQTCNGGAPCIANNSGSINIFGAQIPDRKAVDDAGAFRDLPPGAIRIDLTDARSEQNQYRNRILDVFQREGWRAVDGLDAGLTFALGGPYSGPMVGVRCAAGSDVGRAMLKRLPLLGIHCVDTYQPESPEQVPADLYLEVGRISAD